MGRTDRSPSTTDSCDDAPVDLDSLFAQLRRTPDVEAENLFASDASDSLILDEAADLTGTVVVIGDRYGALTLGALARGAERVRVHQDSIIGERALTANAERLGLADFTHHDLDEELLAGASTVLMQLPRSLDALEEIAERIAAHARPDVRVVAGGRIKHMSRSMNDVLSRSFNTVTASRARQKSRVLHASGPQAVELSWPKRESHHVGGSAVTLVAHGASFAGSSVDIGARTLIDCFDRLPAAAAVIDLGCGTGTLGVTLAMQRPGARVRAFDASAAAIASTAATAVANGVADRVTAQQADGLEHVAPGSAELILLNPPFHIGATVHTGIAERLMREAVRALQPDGELWCVWNSHLGYRRLLDQLGPTQQIVRNAKFTVTATSPGRDRRG